MKYTHIIWDFNGTLFDDVEAGIQSVNILLSQRGLDAVEDIEYYRDIFDFPIEEYYRKLGFDFSVEPYSEIAPKWLDLYLEYSKKSGTVDGIEETLSEISGSGLVQLVLSASEKNMLCGQLEDLGIRKYFSEVLGLDNILAKSKVSVAKAWREKNSDAVVLFVGDTTHDARTAASIGADCVLYCGGHQSRDRLLATGCPVVEDIRRILSIIEE